MGPRIIVLDLDGTLLNSEKQISPANYAALQKAAAGGVHIVPSTGRFYEGMPQVVRTLPFVRYVITINGAEILDTAENRVLHRAEMPVSEALEVFAYLDDLPVVYDCFVDGWGWMARAHYEKVADYIAAPRTLEMVRRLRTPVEDLKAWVSEKGMGVQKIQMFFADMQSRSGAFSLLSGRFPHLIVTSSIANNIELNAKNANKGDALRFLCRQFNVDISDTMAFGDGDNDIPMLRAAGTGVAMQNAEAQVKAAADYITRTNDEDGVALALNEYLRR